MKKTLFIMLTMILLLVGCGGEESSGPESGNQKAENKEPIKIGVLLPATGPFAALGEDVKNGLKLYLEQHDQKLADRDVEVIYEDSEGNPQVALRKARQLILDHKVNFLVSPGTSSELYALRDEVIKHETVMLVPIAAGNGIAWEDKSDYIYRLSFSNWQGGTIAGKYGTESLGKKAIVLYSDYPGGQEGYESFKTAFEADGGEIVETFRPKLGAIDFASYLNQMSQIDADFVYAFVVGSDAVRFLTQFNETGLNKKLDVISPFAFAETTLIDAAGKSALGALCATPYSPWLENELNKKFVTSYREKFSAFPTNQSVAGYDAAHVIGLTVQETGSLKSADLIKALAGLEFESPRGPITIDAETHNPIQNFYLTKNIQGDDRVELEILETYESVDMPSEPPTK